MGLLILSIISAFIIYQRREAFLNKAIQLAQNKAKKSYAIDLQIGKAYFSGFKTVTFEQITAIPDEKPKLLHIDQLAVGLRLWPLLSGTVKIASLEMRNAGIFLVKQDSIRNYDFLYSDESETPNETQGSTKDLNLASITHRLINSVLYKIPQEMKLQAFEASYQDDSTSQHIAVPVAIIKSGKLSSTIQVNHGEATWQAEGDLDPDREKVYIKLYGKGTPMELPVLKTKYGLTLRLDTLETDLSRISWNNDNELKINGHWGVRNLSLQHWRIAANEVYLPDLFIDASILVGSNYVGIDKETELKVRNFTAHPRVKFQLGNQKILSFGVHTDEMNAQDMFDAFPEGLFENLEGIRVSGKLKYDLDFYLDFSEVDSVRLSSTLSKQNFRINSWGKTNLSKINKPFVYTPYEYGKPMRNIVVGPENANFTPIESISPNLKNAVLTAEDPSFYSHQGFVDEAIRTSIVTNLKEKAFKRGGSTISMQLVKNVYLGREKTLARKIEEILMVWLIENNRIVEKDRMFEVYLNVIEWGRNVYGIGEASRYYFSKHPSQLSLGESIYLANIVPKPKSGLYSFQYDGRLKPYLSGYFRLIGNLMARRGLAVSDSTNYGFYDVSLRESLRPRMPDSVAADTAETKLLENEIEETKSFLERLFGRDKKEKKE